MSRSDSALVAIVKHKLPAKIASGISSIDTQRVSAVGMRLRRASHPPSCEP